MSFVMAFCPAFATRKLHETRRVGTLGTKKEVYLRMHVRGEAMHAV